jgi:hypothetical protein
VGDRQEPLFTEDAARAAELESAIKASREKLRLAVDAYSVRAWRTVDLLLESDDGDALFAVARAYYAIYNVALAAATMLEIDLLPFQGSSDFHIKEDAVPHSQMPALCGHLVNLLAPPVKLGDRSPEARATFSLVRQLQKMRKRADYMGTETLSREAGREYAQQAKDLCGKLWRYTCEHVG